MKQLPLLCLILATGIVHAQTLNKQSLELNLQLRREKQADYITRFGDVSYQNHLRLYGTNVGAGVGYNIVNGSLSIKPSIGYYRFSIDKIVNDRIPAWPLGTSKFRPIDFSPDSTLILYSTSKYHYNNLALGLSFGKAFDLKENLSATTQLAFTCLVSFSQHYWVDGLKKGFTTTNIKSFGYLLDYKIGFRKEYTGMYLTTNFVLPLYKYCKQDKIFLEDPNHGTSTWLGGCGLSIGIGKYL